ncbi:MAG TPA: FtsX-like permease family protein, partial [Firmicutes bacterium]|nr:FtsX-like permease family protein [Bacillota bacterium]
DYTMFRGRFFTESEEVTGKRVCVLGYKVSERLFPHENPIGKSITVKGLKGEGIFKVIGVLNPKGQNITVDQDDRFYAPISAVQQDILKKSEISVMYVKVEKNISTDEMIKRIESALRKRYGERAEYFSIKSQEEIMGLLGTISNVFTALIASIAGLSLMVGGVGIMNIMLVTVNERRKEIGIRKAVGATYKNILLQFLSEALILANIGSVSGVILGTIISGMISVAAGWNFIISIPIIFAAIAVANLTGIFFGIYPAKTAALLNPVETLREL